MRFTILTAALALAGSSLAAPAPTTAQLQKDIQTLQITIVNVINDIVQANRPKLKTDFTTGQNQFASLIGKVSGMSPYHPLPPHLNVSFSSWTC